MGEQRRSVRPFWCGALDRWRAEGAARVAAPGTAEGAIVYPGTQTLTEAPTRHTRRAEEASA